MLENAKYLVLLHLSRILQNGCTFWINNIFRHCNNHICKVKQIANKINI